MRIINTKVKKLLEKHKEISLLGRVGGVLGWDMNVNLPPKGAEARAEQMAYVTKLVTERWQDSDLKNLVQTAKDLKINTDEKAILRNFRQGGKFYFNVPKEIIVELSETSSRAFMAWQKAKEEDKFKDFLPHLKKLIKLNQIIADHLGYKENPYDALLDVYEPGLTAKDCQKIFSTIQPELTKLLSKIKNSKTYSPKSELIGGDQNYPVDDQKQIATYIIRKMGYDMEAGRMDVSSHPFTDTLGSGDVRITNRYKVNNFVESLMVALHETGHALYEQGIADEYWGTPLEGGVSFGIHESQSRFWENQIGRSYEFVKFLTPVLHAFYPEQLSKVGTDELYAAFNQVHPSLVRVEADEVTYNLHIALRFELEDSLINGKIKADNLPEIWREKMKKYLGVVPATDREGVLQDVHWSHGMLGYFPTYTLGNLYAAQFAQRMRAEIEIEKAVEKGELGTILSWLRSNIHQYGSLYWPKELIKKVTKEELNPKYFLTYLKEKYSSLYKCQIK